MRQNEVFEEFLKNIYTNDQINTLVDQLDQVKGAVYRSKDGAISEKIAGLVPEGLSAMIKELEKGKIFPKSPQQQAKFTDDFKEYLEAVPRLKLTLGFRPSEKFIAKTSDHLAKQIHQKVILDINVNHSIVAGALVEWGGEYRDYSLARAIDKVLAEGAVKV